MQIEAKERLIVALDTADESQALSTVKALRDRVGTFKVGLELLNSCGIGIVAKIVDLGGQVFVDGKFMDIPNTVAGASRAVCKLKVKMFNVHALAGQDAMRVAVEAAHNVRGSERPLVLVVTVLTSIDQAILNQLGVPGSVEDEVVRLAKLALESGVDGVIASPQEITAIRQRVSPNMLIVTPGVRPTWASPGDQRRVMTPSAAIRNGATHIVVGRPITDPPASIGDPLAAADLVLSEIQAQP